MTATPYEPISPNTDAAQLVKMSQDAHPQPEGLGLRIANKAEFTLVAPIVPGKADELRARLQGKGQHEAGFWEGQVGTVHDLRIVIFDDDTKMLFAATYSDDFKPYVADVIKFATPWIDYMFLDVIEGYPGLSDPGVLDYLLAHQIQASVWYASNPDASPRDLAKSLRLSVVFDDLLDVAQSQ